MNNEKIFFKGINGLRFLAALSVVITHVELLKGSFGFKHYWKEPLIFNLGGLGVYFFFVLSGFLITFLLLKEKEKFGKINIKAFYIRRILRIWPLYYLIFCLGFFVLPHFPSININYLQASFVQNYYPSLILYLFILPNLALSLFSAVPHIGQLWSIGVEEQFYIFWPWLISKSKNIARSLVKFIAVILIIKCLVLIIGYWYRSEDWYKVLKLFVAMSKFECMAIGGLGAYWLFVQNKKILVFIYNRIVLTCSILLIPVLVYFTPEKIQDGVHLVYSLIFLIIIINVGTNTKVWFKLENPLFSYLGKISYGIYMYHFIIIPIVLSLTKSYVSGMNEVVLNMFLYSIILITTILISSMSYEFFEKRFIKIKAKFALVNSGPEER
ncbi:MAG: putative acyltransferase [Bacteroidetes bacterium]|nr:putative acyltransferase [Bacteroidota bacterium]